MKYATENQTIAVVAELNEGAVRPATYELVGFAEALQKLNPARIKIWVLGDDVQDAATALAQATGKEVLGVIAPQLSPYNAQIHQHVLHTLFKEQPPRYICAAHSSQGWDFAPGLAVRMQAACITAVNGVSASDGQIRFSREIYGGKVTADMLSASRTTVLTVQPGSFPAGPTSDPMPGDVDVISISIAPQASRTLSTHVHHTSDLDLSDAKVIVSVGRGIGDAERLDLLHRLAAAIPRSVVCGSRPVIDQGWLSHDRQVGVTGATVAPDLYLACGISGAAQHVCGMQGAAWVVSINSDPMAAIFNQSDICIVEDLSVFVPVLLEKLSETEP